ncbi:MAG: hypothetical protein ACYTG5_04805 [Planctomycetota bacterium]|jgi:hypothetical protein
MCEFEIREAYQCMLKHGEHIEGQWLSLQLALLLRIAPEEAASRMREMAREGIFEIVHDDGQSCEGRLVAAVA